MLIRNIEFKDNAAVAMIAKMAFVELGAPLKNTVYDDPRTDTLYEQFAHRTDAAYFVIEDEGQQRDEHIDITIHHDITNLTICRDIAISFSTADSRW